MARSLQLFHFILAMSSCSFFSRSSSWKNNFLPFIAFHFFLALGFIRNCYFLPHLTSLEHKTWIWNKKKRNFLFASSGGGKKWAEKNILHEWKLKMEMMMMVACWGWVSRTKNFLSVLKFKYLSKNTFCVYFNTIPRVKGGRESLKFNHRQKFLFIILTC